MKINDIETSRFLLRGFTKDDALWAYSIWNNPEMGQYLPDEAKEEIDYEYIKQLEVLGEDEECCYLIPIFKDTLERVGTCSFIASENEKVYDIAYCIHKDFWNRGYATEIAQGMIDYARSQGAEKVTIFVGQDNIASNRVAQKCGGKIVSENIYKKKGTDIIMKDYKYEVILLSIKFIVKIQFVRSIIRCLNYSLEGGNFENTLRTHSQNLYCSQFWKCQKPPFYRIF